MPDSLNKKSQYSGNYYYYGQKVPLLKRGRRNLIIALAIIGLGLLWPGYRLIVRGEYRHLNEARVLWEADLPNEAAKEFESVNRFFVDKKIYDMLAIELLLDGDPEKAFDYTLALLSNEQKHDPRQQVFLQESALLAGSRAGAWLELQSLLDRLADAETESAVLEPTIRFARARLAIQSGNTERGIELIKEALELHPAHEETLLLKAELQTISGNPVERIQAEVYLRDRASKGKAGGLLSKALLISGKYIQTTDPELRNLASKLVENPFFEYSYIMHRMTHLDALLQSIGQANPLASYQITLAQSRLPGFDNPRILQHIYWAQESGILEKSAKEIAAYRERAEDSTDIFWLDARQKALEGNPSQAIALAIKGAENSNEERFKQILLFIARDDQQNTSYSLRQQAVAYLVNSDSLSTTLWIQSAYTLYSLDPSSTNIIERQSEQYQNTEPLLISQLLLSIGSHDGALAALEKATEEERNSRLGLQISFQALVFGKHFEQAAELLDNSDTLGPTSRLLAELSLAFARSNQDQIKPLWREAWSTALKGPNPKLIERLGLLAENFGYAKYAQLAFQQLLEMEAYTPLSTTLHKLASKQLEKGKTREAWQLLERAVTQPEATEAAQVQWAYLSSLLGEEILAARDTLKTLGERSKGSEDWKRAFALSLYQTGNYEEAALTLESFTATKVTSAGYKAISAAILMKLGKTQEARDFLKPIDSHELLPEELNILGSRLREALLAKGTTGDRQ